MLQYCNTFRASCLATAVQSVKNCSECQGIKAEETTHSGRQEAVREAVESLGTAVEFELEPVTERKQEKVKEAIIILSLKDLKS